MRLYKTSKAVGILCLIMAALFIALGAILIVDPDEKDNLVLCVLLFLFAVVMLVLGIIVLVVPTKIVKLVDQKLIFEHFKFEPKNSTYASAANKTLTIPVNEIEEFQIQGASKSSAFWAAFLGGAIGAAIQGNRNPDKLIIKTNDSQVVVYIPQSAGVKIKNNIQLVEKEQTAADKKLDTIDALNSFDDKE